jgi:tetratricopeptide (TPR) repeat protein
MLEEKIPRLVEGADVRGLDLSAQEAFIHACIDGVLNIEDIADVTVLSPAEVSESIDRLVGLRVVEWLAPKTSSAGPRAELVEGIELDEALQRQINEAFLRSDKLNHYELLGVPMDADRGEIRKAYFRLSKTFHPDSYYGKQLGPFKPKLEVLFRRITDAYEAVGRPKKREAYDHYLKRSMAASATELQMNRIEERAQAISRALTKATVTELQPEPVIPRVPPTDESRPSAAPSRPSQAVVPGSPEHQRLMRKRELLERRLAGRGKRPPAPSQPVQSPAPTARVGRKAALRDLTQSLKQTAALTGGIDRAVHHVESARLAEAKGDLTAAAAALRMALALDSNRSDIRMDYERITSLLRVQLVDIHRQQARYEEENNMWAAASLSWAKVADAAPNDPAAPRRAAKALLAAGGDLRKARDFALRGLELDPHSLDTRLVLARIYIEAGMEHSATKELEEAAKLDPGHEMVKNLRKQLGGHSS